MYQHFFVKKNQVTYLSTYFKRHLQLVGILFKIDIRKNISGSKNSDFVVRFL